MSKTVSSITTLVALLLATVIGPNPAEAQDEPGAAPAPAATPAPPPASQGDGALLDRYRAQALSARFSMWQGLRLQRDGRKVELGFFGGNAETIFKDSPRALDDMGTYRTLRISGTVLWSLGLAALVTELVILLVDKDLLIDQLPGGNEIKPLFWGLFIPGLAVGLTGGMMMQGANGYLSDAIHHHNDDLAARLKGGSSASHGRGAVLSYRGRF